MKKMLIVENDILSQNLLQRIFKSDFEIYICDSGEDYYENFGKTKFDIILMDVSLNGSKTGLELIKEIKETEFTEDTPILCLSAHAQTKIRQIAIEVGADLFITKPVQNYVLKEAVDSLVNAELLSRHQK